MVKIINGEIVEDHDPRVKSLFSSHPHLPHHQQQQSQQHQQQQQQQQPQHYLLPPPPSQSPPHYPSPYGYPPPYSYYPQYAAYLHHSPFAFDDQSSPHHFPSHLPTPPPPSASPLTSPSATTRRLSLPCSGQPPPSPSLSSRRLSFSSSASPVLPPPSPSPLPRRLSVSSPSLPLRGLSAAPPPPSSLSSSSSSSSSSLYPRRSPSSYNLFGLPSIYISDIPVKPHVYLLAALLLYFIGPPVLVPLLASFFFYRWHLNREAERKEKERVEAKFQLWRDAKSRGKEEGRSNIHSLQDIQR